jgi:hypothetical protein
MVAARLRLGCAIDPNGQNIWRAAIPARHLPLAPLDSGRKIEQTVIDALDCLDL